MKPNKIEPALAAGTFEDLMRASVPWSEVFKTLPLAGRRNFNTSGDVEFYYRNLVFSYGIDSDYVKSVIPYRDKPAYMYSHIWVFEDGSILEFESDGSAAMMYKNINAAITGYEFAGVPYYEPDAVPEPEPAYDEILAHSELIKTTKTGKTKRKR